MSIYVFGDLQGCFHPLERLLTKLQFDPSQDQLWFTGDLINRGKHSLETLRFVYQLAQQKAAVSVLGNHDISLIAASCGVIPAHKSLKKLLNAPDVAELLDWLKHCRLLHIDEQQHAIIVHAGIPPFWSLFLAEACARQVEAELQNPDPSAWLKEVFGNQPAQWSECFTPIEQQRFTMNALTRMRYCYLNGQLDFEQKLNPKKVAKTHPELIPWYKHPLKAEMPYPIFFGHWSTLGYKMKHQVISLDTGCVWGGKLSAVTLNSSADKPSTLKLTQVNCTDYA